MAKKRVTKKRSSNKMAVVYVKHPGPDDEHGIPVADLEPVEQHGIHCLRGRFFFGDEHWLHGRTITIAADEIAYMVEFKDTDEYKKVIADSRGDQGSPGFGNRSKEKG